MLKNLEAALKNAGSSFEHLVKVNVYLKNMDDFAAMNEVYEKVRVLCAPHFRHPTPPFPPVHFASELRCSHYAHLSVFLPTTIDAPHP